MEQKISKTIGTCHGIAKSTAIRLVPTHPLKMFGGAPQYTWGRNIKNYLTKIDVGGKSLAEVTQNRNRWRSLVGSMYADLKRKSTKQYRSK